MYKSPHTLLSTVVPFNVTQNNRSAADSSLTASIKTELYYLCHLMDQHYIVQLSPIVTAECIIIIYLTAHNNVSVLCVAAAWRLIMNILFSHSLVSKVITPHFTTQRLKKEESLIAVSFLNKWTNCNDSICFKDSIAFT